MRVGGSLRLSYVVPAAIVVLMVSAPGVSAQGLGARAGGTVNPDQFYVGGQYEFGPFAENIWFQPSGDFGFGDNAKLIAGNFDVVLRHAFSAQSEWTAFAGGGPSINHYRVAGVNNTEMGMNIVGGVIHDSGIFAEIRAGFMDSPDARFGIGYRFDPMHKPARRPRR
jgi:hypothetical protein